MQLLALINGVGEAGVGACVAGGAVFFNYDYQCVVVAVGGDADYVLVIAAGFSLEPQLLS